MNSNFFTPSESRYAKIASRDSRSDGDIVSPASIKAYFPSFERRRASPCPISITCIEKAFSSVTSGTRELSPPINPDSTPKNPTAITKIRPRIRLTTFFICFCDFFDRLFLAILISIRREDKKDSGFTARFFLRRTFQSLSGTFPDGS